MKQIFVRLSDPPALIQQTGVAMTMGVFDGLHLGHRKLVDDLRRNRRKDAEIVVVTFDRHPSALLTGDAPVQLLCPELKRRTLAAWGVEYLLELETSRELLHLDPEDFLERLFSMFKPELVTVGEDFRFGRNRRGDAALIRKKLPSARVHELSHAGDEAGSLSATRIRECLAAGDLGFAARMLGRPFSCLAAPGKGDGIGRRIGAPTLNLHPIPPAITNGIYVVRANGIPAVAHLGPRPTLHKEERRFEVHIIDREIIEPEVEYEVEFLKRLRDVLEFPSPEEMGLQIQKDIWEAREVLERCHSSTSQH